MKLTTTRVFIILLTLFTAIVHLVVLNLGGLQPMFLLNGLGYFALLGALLLGVPEGEQKLVHYAFMAYAAVTIVAWYVVNQGTANLSSMLGISTKIVEVALIVFLWLDLRETSA